MATKHNIVNFRSNNVNIVSISCTLLKGSAQVFLNSHTLKMILPTPEIYGEHAMRSEIKKLIIKLRNYKG